MIVAKFLINFLINVQPLWKFIEAKAHCHKGSCQKYTLVVYRDGELDSAFVDHVFRNSVTSSPVQCFNWCTDNCRCLSFNYKENHEGKYCELNEGSHFTNKSSLVHSPGSRYYNLRREHYLQGVTSCVGDVTCTNGCCRNNPCLNGGTCKEICEPTSVRYNCSCPVPFFGKRCEIHPRRSCQDYKAAGIKTSGLYTIEDDNSRTIEVYCDFHSEPGFAWNLVESFSLSKKDLFQSDVVFYDYSDSSAVSGDAPNWEAYLMKRHFLVWLRDHSTHWRATCRYNTDGTPSSVLHMVHTKLHEGKCCELNEGNHFTNKRFIVHSPGSSYYNLHRGYSAKVKF
ncbi:hypothetical protein OS493_000557 [Desmophyllum pertusum]|uniref:EGF-like domain-containing protein n=1 Tax=Desmophyllum pertusum TaxID=174260 RepID=A0A9X0A791_9CNID|nr:hypothetical protein OS493_000557 [Desmophyllum pertusum]